MDVEGLPEEFHRHRRALEMPPGASPAPGRIPRRAGHLVFGLCRFPQREVLGVLLGVVVLNHTGARLHFAGVETRELPISLELVDRVVN